MSVARPLSLQHLPRVRTFRIGSFVPISDIAFTTPRHYNYSGWPSGLLAPIEDPIGPGSMAFGRSWADNTRVLTGAFRAQRRPAPEPTLRTCKHVVSKT